MSPKWHKATWRKWKTSSRRATSSPQNALALIEKGRVKMSLCAWHRDQKAAEAEANGAAEEVTTPFL